MFFSTPVLFEVPVRPRVQKFMRATYAQPMLATAEAEGLLMYIWALAQPEKILLHAGKSGKASRRKVIPQICSAYIGVGIQEFHGFRHQNLLNYAELLVLDTMATHIMQKHFLDYVEASAELPMQALRDWTDLFDFSDDDFSETNLKQILIHHRRVKGQSPFTRHQLLTSTERRKAA